jgi:hypothetical protein
MEQFCLAVYSLLCPNGPLLQHQFNPQCLTVKFDLDDSTASSGLIFDFWIGMLEGSFQWKRMIKPLAEAKSSDIIWVTYPPPETIPGIVGV